MKDATSGMYFHAHDTKVISGGTAEFWANTTTGNSANIWLRACGWLLVALADLLEYYPEGTNKEYIKSMFAELAAAYIPYKTSNNVFRQLPILAATVDGYTNYEEESGTAQAAYAIMKGARCGYLDSSYLNTGTQIFLGCFNTFVKDKKTGGPVTGDTTSIQVGPLCVTAGMPNTGSASKTTKDGSVKYYIYNGDKTSQSSSYAQ